MHRRNRRGRVAHDRRPRQQPPPVQARWEQWLAQVPEALRPLARRTMQRRPDCLLCQAPFHAVGVFVPWDPAYWGCAAGWRAGCCYGVCRDCVRLPDLTARVQRELWQSRDQLSAPWN
jgi:hypothetical protein